MRCIRRSMFGMSCCAANWISIGFQSGCITLPPITPHSLRQQGNTREHRGLHLPPQQRLTALSFMPSCGRSLRADWRGGSVGTAQRCVCLLRVPYVYLCCIRTHSECISSARRKLLPCPTPCPCMILQRESRVLLRPGWKEAMVTIMIAWRPPGYCRDEAIMGQ